MPAHEKSPATEQHTVTVTAATRNDLVEALRSALADLQNGTAATQGKPAANASYRYEVRDPQAPEVMLSDATATSASSEETEVRAALRDLCRNIRQEFPDAAVVVLDDSDQGDWAVVSDVRDGLGNDLDLGDFDDPDDCAAHLYGNRNYLWAPYLVAGTSLDRRNPCRGAIVIEKVLADLG